MAWGGGAMAPGDSPRSQLDEDAQRDVRIETSHIVHCSLSVPACSKEVCCPPPLSLKVFSGSQLLCELSQGCSHQCVGKAAVWVILFACPQR